MKKSILNIRSFLIANLYVKPLTIIRNLNRKSVSEFIRDNILLSKDSDVKIIMSVMFGVFMGFVPIWGWQLATAVALAYLLRLNKLLVFVAANISIPPLIPIFIYLSFVMGGFILNGNLNNMNSITNLSVEFLKQNLLQYIVGSFFLAFVLSFAFGILTFLFIKIFRKTNAS